MKTLILPICFSAVLAAAAGAAQAQDPRAAADATPAVLGTSGNVAVPLAPDYRLGPGDKIRVDVRNEQQYSQDLQVRPDGKITLPLVGDVSANGLTPIQLRDAIAAALKEYVKNPVVTVMVVEALGSTVYVIGEVNKPGTITLVGPTTAVQALAMAGGFKDFAKTRDIHILRQGPNGLNTIHFNYDKAITGRDEMIYVQRGDTIIVR